MASKRTGISRAEYLQIVGLLALSATHNRRLQEIEIALREITQETELRDGEYRPVDGWGAGWTGEAVYQTEGAYPADELLRKIGLTVEDPE